MASLTVAVPRNEGVPGSSPGVGSQESPAQARFLGRTRPLEKPVRQLSANIGSSRAAYGARSLRHPRCRGRKPAAPLRRRRGERCAGVGARRTPSVPDVRARHIGRTMPSSQEENSGAVARIVLLGVERGSGARRCSTAFTDARRASLEPRRPAGTSFRDVGSTLVMLRPTTNPRAEARTRRRGCRAARQCAEATVPGDGRRGLIARCRDGSSR